jgi:UDP-MurNAc hydroxylase
MVGAAAASRPHDPHRRRRQRALPHRRARHGRRLPEGEGARVRGEECIYWYTIPADLVSTNIADHEIDWSNSIFLSMQFEVGRSGKFNEFLTTFLKCLSRDRIEYVENWYAEQSDQTEDAEIDEWTVQRRCPHLRADLTKTGKIEDGVLTCALHDWKWDLASGQCLTAPGHPIRASRVVETASARTA